MLALTAFRNVTIKASPRKAVLCPNGAEHASPGQSEAGVPANVAPGTQELEPTNPERAIQDSPSDCSALSGLCVFVDSQPGASLCPRLICSASSGQCPSLHVNRRRPRRIRPPTLPPDETESTALGEVSETESTALGEGLRPRRNRRPKVSRESTVLGEVARKPNRPRSRLRLWRARRDRNRRPALRGG
jgi:hypothetical protein